MPSSTSRRTPPQADPESARATADDRSPYADDYDDPEDRAVGGPVDDGDEMSPAAVVAAGLIGAAIGAGIGYLVSRAAAEEEASFAEAMRRRALRARREAGRAATRVERKARRAGSDAADDVTAAVAGAVRALGRTREEFGDRIERELRALRKATQRGRRRGWLR